MCVCVCVCVSIYIIIDMSTDQIILRYNQVFKKMTSMFKT